MVQRFMRLMLVLVVLGLWADPTVADEVKKRPNILFIMADDLGWNDVGYHDSIIKTKNIDALAKSGVRLEQFYVMPVCSPTRASLITGRYTIRYGLQTGVVRPWARYGLPLNERTLAAVLRDAGYFTAISGKWHLGSISKEYLPLQRGFDYQYGHYLGALDYWTHKREEGLDWHRMGKALREEGYTTNLIGNEATTIIKKHNFQKNPLFLYVPFNSPHTPLQAPEKYIAQYQDVKNKKRRIYAAMVTCMDDNIGRIVEVLKDRGEYENTLIIFCSDNGGPITLGASNTPLRGSKGTLYAGGVRVVAFAVWPGKLKAGSVNNEPLHMVDWYPTLIKLGQGKLKQKLSLDGSDIWPTIAEGKKSPRKEILFNAEAKRGALYYDGWKVVVTRRDLPIDLSGNLKFGGKKKSGKIELFHLDEDPTESTNLASKKPKKTIELLKRLNKYAKEAVPAKGRNGKRPKNFRAPEVWGETPFRTRTPKLKRMSD
ncbi:MAG: arylsulfatase [Gemmataceae bacterium]